VVSENIQTYPKEGYWKFQGGSGGGGGGDTPKTLWGGIKQSILPKKKRQFKFRLGTFLK